MTYVKKSDYQLQLDDLGSVIRPQFICVNFVTAVSTCLKFNSLGEKETFQHIHRYFGDSIFC